MKKYFTFIVFTLMTAGLFAQKMVTIQGKVTDFDGKPICSALIEAKTRTFDMKYHAFSDEQGNYSIQVEAGTYLGISCVRMADYAKTKLEFWAWNVPAYENMTINMRYDKLEVYGVNAFRVQGAYRGYSIYCRPMGLTRYLNWLTNPSDVMPLAPDPEKMRIEISINGVSAKVNKVEQVNEYAGKKESVGYMIYTELGTSTSKPYDEFRITITDMETGDKGEAVYFKYKESYVD